MNQVGGWGFTSRGMKIEEEFCSSEYDAEGFSGFQDPNELLAALKQKEEEVILAAELGNALLLENRQLKEENDKLHEQYGDKLEELEQDKHDLRLKLEQCRSAWDGQVIDLEREVRDLIAERDRLTRALRMADRDQSHAQQESADNNRRLREQLDVALEMERMLSAELTTLRQEVQRHGRPGAHDEEVLAAMKRQMAHLSQREQELELRVQAMNQENAALQENIATLNTRLALQEECSLQQLQQLAEAQTEVRESHETKQQLQDQVEELQVEMFLQNSSGTKVSLQAELEHSPESQAWSQEKEQVKKEVLSILSLLVHLTEKEKVPCQEDCLQATLLQLQRVARELAAMLAPQRMKPSVVTAASEDTELIRQLREQNSLLMEENAHLKDLAENNQQGAIAQKAIQERDEAIAKKNAMEAELLGSKIDMMSMTNQLLEAIQRKMELSQELEAWQDDIQVIVNHQVKSQEQSVPVGKKSGISRLAFLRRPSTPCLRGRRPSSSSSSASLTSHAGGSERKSLPWLDWLRRGRIG